MNGDDQVEPLTVAAIIADLQRRPVGTLDFRMYGDLMFHLRRLDLIDRRQDDDQ